MPKAFKALRKGLAEMYTVPDIMKQATNIKLVSADGIFFDGTYFNKMYFLQTASQNRVPFEGIFALLRKENVRFQCRKEYPDGKNYLTLFCKGEIPDESILTFFAAMEQKVSKQIFAAGLPLKLISIDTDTRLKMLHAMTMDERKPLEKNYLSGGMWLKDLRMPQINWAKSHDCFLHKGDFQKIFMICTISAECESLYLSIEAIPDIRLIVSEFSAISDSLVIKHMESLYLDVNTVYAKLRKRNPDLYNAYVNGAKVDTYGYSFSGMLLLLSSPTKDMLRDNEYLLQQAAKSGKYQVISLYGSQRENFLSMLPTASFPLQTRVHPTDAAIEFFPYVSEGLKQPEREGESHGV